jgi:PAS domain-containing protein
VIPDVPSGGNLGTAATVTGLGRLRMLSRIAEQVGEGVAVVDNEAWIVYANDAFLTMHRCTRNSIGRRCTIR